MMPRSLVLSFGIVAALALSPGGVLADDGLLGFPAELDTALSYAKLTRRDLSFRTDYVEIDPFRLSVVDAMMAAPLDMPGYAQKLSDSLSRCNTVSDMAAIGLSVAEMGGTSPVGRIEENYRPFEEVVLVLAESDKTQPLAARQKYLLRRSAEALCPDLRDVLAAALSQFIRAELLNAEAFSRLDPAQEDSVIYGFTLLLYEDEMDEFKDVETLDSLQQLGEEWSEKLVALAGKIDQDLLGQASMRFASAVDRLTEELESLNLQECLHKADSDGFLFYAETPSGIIAVGDTTSQVYSGDILLVLDLGGDDVYRVGYHRRHYGSCIIDLGGDDYYSLDKSDNYVAGETSLDVVDRPTGIAGMEAVIDYGGDDVYQASDFALGAGIFGFGVLHDYDGDDRYFGDTFTMGAGCFGVGILADDSGDDGYSAALFSQGFGYVKGLGALLDGSGNDYYLTGFKYKDILRYDEHYVTLSQGFGFGVRPWMSGGVGLLADRSGDDFYLSDIFGQGSSYWFSLGMLYDSTGSDRYNSFQYAQGAATHLTAGILVDLEGDDAYFSKGVSQGCGHDWAPGILYDRSGNDVYTATDLSQGAGSANGLGFLIDFRGDDAYYVKSDKNTQGYGNPRREYGSIGVFLDLQGRDRYDGGPGADSSVWEYSTWGIGFDK